MSTATLTAPYSRPHDARVGTAPRATYGQDRASRPAPGPTRLTRRGRLVLLVAVLALAFAGFALLGGPALSTGETHHPAQHTVIVGGGETLWDIASRIAPGEDPRVVIGDIVDLNHLSDAGSIRIGQKIFVPTY